MKNKMLFATALAAFALASVNLHAQPTTYPTAKGEQVAHYMFAPSTSLFNGQELAFQVGPQYTLPGNKNILTPGGGHGVWGVDFAGDYWINRYGGVGVSTGIVDTHKPNDLVFDELAGTINGRLPFDFMSKSSPFKNVAALAKVGFGRDFQTGQFETTLQAGPEIRLWKHLGVGADYRKRFEFGRVKNEDQIQTYLTFAF